MPPGKGGKRREFGLDPWAWEQLDAWLEIRGQLPISTAVRDPRTDRKPTQETIDCAQNSCITRRLDKGLLTCSHACLTTITCRSTISGSSRCRRATLA